MHLLRILAHKRNAQINEFQKFGFRFDRINQFSCPLGWWILRFEICFWIVANYANSLYFTSYYSRSSSCDHSSKRPALVRDYLCEIPFELWKDRSLSNLDHFWDPAHSLMSRAMSHVWPVNTLFQIGLITNCVRNYPIKNANICPCDSAGFDCELIRARSTRNNGKKWSETAKTFLRFKGRIFTLKFLFFFFPIFLTLSFCFSHAQQELHRLETTSARWLGEDLCITNTAVRLHYICNKSKGRSVN